MYQQLSKLTWIESSLKVNLQHTIQFSFSMSQSDGHEGCNQIIDNPCRSNIPGDHLYHLN